MDKRLENIKYTNRIVAFIDILGFKQIIKESENNNFKLQLIYECLTFLKTKEKAEEWDLTLIEIEEDAQKKGIESFDISKTTVCTCFSDSIVVSTEYTKENVNEAASTLIANLAFIGAKLMTEGILIRGAITLGKLLHIETGLIMGQALIDAYQIERNASKYPRIILSDRLIKELNYPIETKKERYPYHQYVDRFEDGCVGFHQMSYFQVIQSWTESTNDILKTQLNKIKHTIINGLDNSFEIPDIHEKYYWLKKQYKSLIILTDGIKEKIYSLNENIPGHNIHYSYTDKFYYSNDKD